MKMNGLKTERFGLGVAVMKCTLGMLESGGVRTETMLAVVLAPWLMPAPDSSRRHLIVDTIFTDPVYRGLEFFFVHYISDNDNRGMLSRSDKYIGIFILLSALVHYLLMIAITFNMLSTADSNYA